MKKILIFGNSGAGKSTLAKNLKDKFDLQHLDLDILAWLDTQPPSRRPLNDSFNDIDAFLSENESWVIEGGYVDLLDYVTKKANEVVFLNPGTEVCIEHCRKRPWEPHKYASKEEQDKNLDMLIIWVRDYIKRDDEFSLKAHKSLFNSFSGKKIEIREEKNIL